MDEHFDVRNDAVVVLQANFRNRATEQKIKKMQRRHFPPISTGFHHVSLRQASSPLLALAHLFCAVHAVEVRLVRRRRRRPEIGFLGVRANIKDGVPRESCLSRSCPITLAAPEAPSRRTLREVWARENDVVPPHSTLLFVWLLCCLKMARFSCFSNLLIGKKKKSEKSSKAVDAKRVNSTGDLRVKPEDLVHPSLEVGTKEASFEDSVPLKAQGKSSLSNSKVDGNGNTNEILTRTTAAVEAAYEGGDEHDDVLSMKRDFSDFDLQALAMEKRELAYPGFNQEFNNDVMEYKLDKVAGITPKMLDQSGHVSDPGMGRTTAFWGSPSLKRSCSNIERKRSGKLLASPTKSYSCEDLQKLAANGGGEAHGILGSPLSVMTSCSADKVMLKKRSSSQVLPSRSRKLWWKLFLWSHRNLHKSWISKPERRVSTVDASKQKGGYCSDTLEPSCKIDKKNKKPMEEPEIRTDLWPQNQWVAFYAESSSLDRVDAWVHSLDDSPFYPIDDDEVASGVYANMDSTEVGEPSGKNQTGMSRRTMEEIVQANKIVESLNSLSAVAHISCMGLKVIPAISAFNSLRVVNLSGNFIVHISPGSLPKSLHMLDLSRNKIATIEGLRELTKLRVLNLSYNRISRIGHGLSNCILIKELYLTGNKISDVEGLHRLLKLTVLDLSFNKISTAKALGQLVANYDSLLALNLLGNPIQTNIGDDQLRKAVCSLLPQLAYLNKQPTKPHREVVTGSIAKAALGDNGWHSRRRSTRRVIQSTSSSVKDEEIKI
ncbi:leucine rich repeat domain containing protein [Musa troglodytarum]|uniref:Leucine rich repeat domain containing protein n=1 Tax=Musa troglodytarum TaxID=320322 RepID=A0A9E7HGB9_9LILI|nr:leucine rich repeat domain containing protein [Musa troglodytarum]